MARIFAGLIAALALAVGCVNVASAQQAWQSEWARIVAAAKNEGMMVIGAPAPAGIREAVTQLWTKEFPDISLNWVPASGPQWPPRIQAERQAGKYLWDVYFSGPGVAAYRLAPQIFEPLREWLVLPELKDPTLWGGWENAFPDKGGDRLMSIWESLGTPLYNAKFVAPEKVKQLGLGVLLDPAYKGMIGWQDPRERGPGQNLSSLIAHVLGEDGLKRVIVAQESVFFQHQSHVAEAMMRERIWFALAGSRETFEPYRQAGMSLDSVRPIGQDAKTAYLNIGAVIMGVFDRAPHPNAAKLFVNWVLTKPVQEALQPVARTNSRRRDVAKFLTGEEAAQPGEPYLSIQRESGQDERLRVQEIVKALRPN